MSTTGTLEALAQILGEALSPLAERLQGNRLEETVEQLGIRLPEGSLASGGLPTALQSSATICSQLPNAVAALVTAIGGSDEGALISAAVQLGQRIVQAGTAFTQLATAMNNVVNSAAGLTPAQKTKLSAAAQAIPERLMHLALISYVEDRQPGLKGALDLAGFFDDTAVPGDPTDASQPPFHLKRVRFDRLASLLSDPANHLKDVYGFGRPDFDGLELFRRIKTVVDREDAEAIIITPPGQPAAIEAFVFRIAVEPGAIPGLRARLRVPAEKDVSTSISIGGPWSATIDSSARFAGGIEAVLHPQQGLHIEPPTAAVTITFAFGIKAERSDGQHIILVGQAGGSRLELKSVAARFPLQVSASTGSPSPQVQLGASLGLKEGKLVIDASHADSFISTLLGGVKVESGFDLSALYDTKEGLRFTGSATIEISLPAHLSLGPVSIENLYLIGGFKDGKIPIEFSADMSAQLGPLAASVSRMGALATVSFPKGGGNAGPAQIDVGFKAPTGVGLSVDAGVVKGGGFLYIDPDRGEYAGALELGLFEVVTIKAIGIITTKMPDGSSGFSLLIIMSVEFGTGIQLGFGFTLLAVGGLLGLNRTMNLQALGDGIRSGAIESVMFPRDIIANAPKIISDLKAFFPPRNGIFLIGPMVKLGWGTPTLVSLSLGIIIEIPGNIAIVGILQIALPTVDAALIKLQVNFIGAIEFDKKRIWFFAAMFDSRVLFLTIEGEMGLLVAFGDDANFVVSVGGFHPRFSPPPLPFPSPRRIAISILNTPVARVRVEGYFAVTSNTVQFGARLEVFFGLDAINVQGHFAFDALFQFSPFYFVIQISASLSVNVFGAGLFSVSLSGTLEGPAPWHIEGHGSISILFFDIGVDFSETWGENKKEELPPIPVFPLIQGELDKAETWRAFLPQGATLLVSLRKMQEAEAALILHPVGMLRISQRAVPFDLKLDKIGSRKPSDVNRMVLSVTGGGLSKKADVFEQFAPAQYQNFSDSDKLSKPAFGPEHSGLDLSASGNDLRTSGMVRRVIRYEEIIIDNNFKRFARRFSGYFGVLFQFFLNGAAVTKCDRSKAAQKKLKPFDDKITVKSETYTVAFQANNKAVSTQAASFYSEASARDFMNSQITNDPAMADQIHVIPSFERAA